MLYFAVDSGTTNSRVWLMHDRDVLDRRLVPVGVRNTAIDGNTRALAEGIRRAVLEMASKGGPGNQARTVIAAGMITSNLGLHEVKHVQTPAGIQDLASGIQQRHFEGLEGTSFYFIPGVRCGPSEARLDNVNCIDIMRGEETEVIGALEEIPAPGPLLYIHLGSHTKLIQIDASQRLVAGASTLAGELTQSILQQTILRSSLPETPSTTLDPDFFNRGWENCQQFGFTRALYQVRIFNLNSSFAKEVLASFFLGTILCEEFRCLTAFTETTGIRQVLLSGLPHLQPAWTFALERSGFSVRRLTAEETERCFLTGLLRIFEHNQSLPA
ncbi:MAG: 2-dehydro-3-deoxygalactonokinase [Acidobacteria bacterium]|nr:2-dehydro-3-deoxygalactonokinase [Acidobacteriota bacterium]MCI0719248.1 2-dehydro-3-deoxygalactonokinase [Acidobacteriota bacterium]